MGNDQVASVQGRLTALGLIDNLKLRDFEMNAGTEAARPLTRCLSSFIFTYSYTYAMCELEFGEEMGLTSHV